MSQTLADDSEVMFGQQEEIAGAMEMEGSLQNRRGKETWLEATEPYRGARPRMRDFDRLVDGELGATSGDVEDEDKSPAAVLEDCGSYAARFGGTTVRKSISENTKGSKTSAPR